MDKRQTGKRTDRQKRKKTDILEDSDTKRETKNRKKQKMDRLKEK